MTDAVLEQDKLAADTRAAFAQAVMPETLYRPLQTTAEMAHFDSVHRAQFPIDPNYVSDWTAADDERLMAKHYTPKRFALEEAERKGYWAKYKLDMITGVRPR